MRYLSDTWFAAADAAVRKAAGSAPDGRLVIDQHVDEVAYRVEIAGAASQIRRLDPTEPTEPPDATFRQSRRVAEAIARRETDAHQEFLLGSLGFEGDIDALIARRDHLGWLEEVLRPVMAETQWSA